MYTYENRNQSDDFDFSSAFGYTNTADNYTKSSARVEFTLEDELDFDDDL